MKSRRIVFTGASTLLPFVVLLTSVAAMCNEYSIKVVNDTPQEVGLTVLNDTQSEKHGVIARKRGTLAPGQSKTTEDGSVGSTIIVRVHALPNGAPLCVPVPESYWRLLSTVKVSNAVPCSMRHGGA